MNKYHIIGDSPIRVDALDKVTGRAKFTADFKEPRMLHLKVLRSPYPHARITNIDTSKAEKLAGVRGIVRPEDAPKKRIGTLLNDRYILPCDNIVRYVGEPIVMVAADTPDIAEDGVDLIHIEYEQLPTIFNTEEAIKDTTPAIVHSDRPNYVYDFHPRYGEMRVPDNPNMPNLQNAAFIYVGDVEQGFKESDVIVESRFETESEQQCPLETHVFQAWTGADGSLTVRASQQGYFHMRMFLARLFDMQPSEVRVLGPYLGGGFGSKLGRSHAPLAALAAKKLNRAVQLQYTRKEDLTSGGRNSGLTVLLKAGVTKSGEIRALDAKVFIDGGAYGGDLMGVIPRTSVNCLCILYRIPNLRAEGYAVYTNNPPACTFRGVEAHNVSWAMEQQWDICADEIGMDSTEFRLKNLLTDGEENPVGEITESLGVREGLEKTSAWIGWGEQSETEPGWATAKGVAIGPCLVGLGYTATSKVQISNDDTIQLYFGSSEMGQGSHTAFAQMVAEEFKTSLDKVKVVYGDTDITSWDWDNQASRTTVSTGQAVVRACRDAKRQIKELAGPKMGLAPEDLDIKDGVIYCIDFPSTTMLMKDLFATAGFVKGIGNIIGLGEFTATAPPMDPKTGRFERLAIWSTAAYAAEVAVNLSTGEVKIKRLAGAVDVGQPINSKMVEQQIDGGMAQGVGFTLTEQLVYENGQLRNPDLVNYKIPMITDIPTGNNYTSIIVANPHEDGPYGAKGCGESPMVAVSGAIANAVYNATGKRIYRLPITREVVLSALKSSGS